MCDCTIVVTVCMFVVTGGMLEKKRKKEKKARARGSVFCKTTVMSIQLRHCVLFHCFLSAARIALRASRARKRKSHALTWEKCRTDFVLRKDSPTRGNFVPN